MCADSWPGQQSLRLAISTLPNMFKAFIAILPVLTGALVKLLDGHKRRADHPEDSPTVHSGVSSRCRCGTAKMKGYLSVTRVIAPNGLERTCRDQRCRFY